MSSDHDRLTDLFGEAMELEPAERAAMLAKLRTTDPTLVGELEALLEEDSKIVTALRTAGLRPSDFAPGTKTSAVDRIAIPGFTLGAKLGEGGMGVVYAAEQAEPQRTVAIKILHAASDEAQSRFRAEGAIMSKLEHPGIAAIYATGDAANHPYIVMEHIAGTTLDKYVEANDPPLAERLDLIAQVCDALHHAHTQGVVHRDLKPANIMVRPDKTIAILDFGVARAAMLSGATQPGDFLGTPLYMSPEQAMGRADEVDPRSDVYSVGVTLYELVADVPPFDLRGLSLSASIRKILQHPAPPLEHDPILDAIADRALQKLPAQRYPTCAALAAELRRYLARR